MSIFFVGQNLKNIPRKIRFYKISETDIEISSTLNQSQTLY